MKHYLCPINSVHGELAASLYTPGAYRCTVCNGLFDAEKDLAGKGVRGLSPKQESLYQELVNKHTCKVPVGLGKWFIAEKFLIWFPRSLLIVGTKQALEGFSGNQSTTYHSLNRVNIHAYDQILIDKTTFGLHSLLISNLLDHFQKNYPEKQLYFIGHSV